MTRTHAGSLLHFVTAVASMILSSCGGSNRTPSNAWTALDGQTFVSASDQLPIGEILTGTVYGHWILVFSRGAVCWGHDDALRDDGTYTCNGWALQGHFFDLDVSGLYDSDTKLLTWNGDQYVVFTDQTLGVRYCGL